MWGGKIAENTFLKINSDSTFTMGAGSVNEVVRVALVMGDDAEIGKLENVNFTEPKLDGNAKLGTADSFEAGLSA